MAAVVALAGCTAAPSGTATASTAPRASSPSASATPTAGYVTVTLSGTDANYCYSDDRGSYCEVRSTPLSFELGYTHSVTIVASVTSQGPTLDARCTVVSESGVTVIDQSAHGQPRVQCDTVYAGR